MQNIANSQTFFYVCHESVSFLRLFVTNDPQSACLCYSKCIRTLTAQFLFPLTEQALGAGPGESLSREPSVGSGDAPGNGMGRAQRMGGVGLPGMGMGMGFPMPGE